jgi:hypothetical protein
LVTDLSSWERERDPALMVPIVVMEQLTVRIDTIVLPRPQALAERILGDGVALILATLGLALAILGFAGVSTEIGIIGLAALVGGSGYRALGRWRRRRLTSKAVRTSVKQ